MSLESDMLKVVQGAIQRAEKTTPYDTPAKVVRVEDDTVWVHIDNGVSETPAKKTIDAKKGDTVQVRVSGGSAWLVGNETRPPTDDATANYAVNIANETNKTVVQVQSYVVEEIDAQRAIIGDLEADTAKIHSLTAEQLTATVGYIGALTAGSVTASDIVADHAAIGSLDATYASIDLANVNNAWIQNGVIKNGAIADAQIIGVSANKLTAGTIDASNITVTNLNASNITTGSITVDGITIDVTNNEASIDGSHIDDGTITLSGLAQEVTDKIDGAIETFTGNAVPTLNNYPASSWTTSTVRDTHIGDVYYVINAGNQADGYCYRFAKSGNTYQWVLIKDSDVTAALQRLTEAEGDIAGLESFESTTSSWITETDEELSSLKTNVTSLTTRVGEAEDEIETKVDTSTFNTLSQTVGENSANITSLTTITTNNGLTSSTNISNTVNNVSQKATSNESKISNLTTVLGTNADGTTKSTDIVHQVSDISQDLSGITTRVGKTEVQIKGSYATSSTAKGTTAKAATIVPAVTGWELYTGATITVKFTNENTATSPTLNVNSTGAKGIRTYSGGTLSEDERKWPAGATMSFVYDGEYWRIQDSTELTRLKAAESSITQTADSIVSLVANNDTYTKPDGTTATNTIKSAIKQNADNIELRVEKSGVIASINASTETSGGSVVKISADKVNIEGAAIFTGSGRLSTTSLDAAYDANGAASNAVSALATDLASSSGTTVINGGNIITGTVSADQIASNAITADKIAANAITLSDMDSSTKDQVLNSEIEIGGKNLLQISEYIEVAGGPDEIEQDGWISDSTPTSDSRSWSYANSQWQISLSAGDYILSYEVKTSASNSAEGYRVTSSSGTSIVNEQGATIFGTVGTFKKGFTLANAADVGLMVKTYGAVVRFKLEKGNKATDWTPAPEDVNRSISILSTTTDANLYGTTTYQYVHSGVTETVYKREDGTYYYYDNSQNEVDVAESNLAKDDENNIIEIRSDDGLTARITSVEVDVGAVNGDIEALRGVIADNKDDADNNSLIARRYATIDSNKLVFYGDNSQGDSVSRLELSAESVSLRAGDASVAQMRNEGGKGIMSSTNMEQTFVKMVTQDSTPIYQWIAQSNGHLSLKKI